MKALRFAKRFGGWLATIAFLVVATIPALICAILFVTLKALACERASVKLKLS